MGKTKWRRAVTAVAASASALALTAPGATAAPTDVINFSGISEALSFDLKLSAPGGLLNAVPGTKNGVLSQRVSQTLAQLTGDTGKATVTLLDGVLNNILGQGSGECDGKTRSILAQDLGIVSVGVGNTRCAVDPSKGLAQSASELAHLKVSLESVLGTAALPANTTAQLTEQVDTAIETVGGLVGELNGVLKTVEDTVNSVEGATPLDLPEVSIADLGTDKLRELLSGELLTVEKLWSKSEVVEVADRVTSKGNAGIVRAALLGGLVEVPAFEYSTMATTNGKPGGASAEATTTTIAVKLAGDDVVSIKDGVLNVAGVQVDLGSGALSEQQSQDLLNTITGLLGDILDAAGLSVLPGKGETFVAPDGSSATATASAFAVSLTPLNALSAVLGEEAAQQLNLTLNLLPNTAKVAAAAQAIQPPSAPKEPAPPVSLPRTGGGAAAALAGLMAMAGALSLRRR